MLSCCKKELVWFYFKLLNLRRILPPPPPQSLYSPQSLIPYLFFILLSFLILASCGDGEVAKSNEAEIKELTLTVNNNDYVIDFDENRAYTVIIPHTETIPSQVTAKSLALSEKATGLLAGDALPVTAKQIALTITSEDQSVQNTYYINLVFPRMPLTATQIQVVDGTKQDNSRKFPSNFMIFDIQTANAMSEKIPVEFLLVKNGDNAPGTLEAFRKTVAVTLLNGSYDLVMSHKSAILPSGLTSLYLSHDSAGRYPLEPDTGYTLYELQPESNDSAPKSLGSFATGTYATYTGDLAQHIEDPGTADNSGRFYIENEQFFVLTSLFGQAILGLGSDVLFSSGIKLEGSLTAVLTTNDKSNTSRVHDFDAFLGNTEKPFPFFHAILGSDDFFAQAGVEYITDLKFITTTGIAFYEVWDPVMSGLSPTSSSAAPVLSWDAVAGAGKYKIQGAVSMDAVATATVEELTQPTYTWPAALAAGDTLYWRVRALDTAGAEGPWSYIASVSIEAP